MSEVERVLEDVLASIAPEADLASVPGGAILREELDLDSMDLLAIYTGLCERLSIQIPESDYPKIATRDGLVAYLIRKTSSGAP